MKNKPVIQLLGISLAVVLLATLSGARPAQAGKTAPGHSSAFGSTVGPISFRNLIVSNGLFATSLDFGNAFPGADRWSGG